MSILSSSSLTRGWRGGLLALVAGAILPLGLSPFTIWPLLLLSPALLFWLSHNVPVKTAMGRGFWFGVGSFGAGTSWIYVSIHQFGSAPLPLAASLTGGFVVALALLFFLPMTGLWRFFCLRLKVNSTLVKALSFSAFWVLFEWLRSWVLTGFPWLYLGSGMLDSPLAPWAPVIGVYGMSLITVVLATALTCLLMPGQKKAALITLVIASIAGLLPIPWLSQQHWTTSTGKTVNVTAVQANIPQLMKWEPGFLEETLNRYLQLSNNHWDSNLVVWPENALPIVYPRSEPIISSLQQLVARHHSVLISGMPFMEQRPGSQHPSFYNGMMSISQDGIHHYYKQKLVPFGEYVPLESMLRGLIQFFNLPMSNFATGDSQQPRLQAGPWEIAPYICYEIVYPDFGARQARSSDFLITISNDTWFGRSIGPLQHFQIARMMAAQTGRYLIRGTNDGVTALVDPTGQVIKQIPQFEPGVLTGQIEVMHGSTPFMRWQSWPVLSACLLLLLFSAGCAGREAGTRADQSARAKPKHCDSKP